MRKVGWLIAGAIIAYLLIGGGIAWWLHDRVPLIVIMLLNYALCAAIIGPTLMLLPQRR